MRATTKPNEISARIPSDGQLSGLSGELFVAAELLRRGHQVAITMAPQNRWTSLSRTGPAKPSLSRSKP